MEKVSIIIVDEDQSTAKGIALALQKYFSKVTSSNSPSQAKKLLKDNNYSVIISELTFSTEEGIELLKYFRQLSKSTPIVIISAHLNENAKLELERLNIKSILEKPVTVEIVKNEVLKLI